MSEIEHFMTLLMDKEEEGTLSPILSHGGVRFMWIKHNNLYCILQQWVVSSVSVKMNSCLLLCNFTTRSLLYLTLSSSGCNIEEEC